MARKVLWLVSGCYLIVLGVLGLTLHNASPGPVAQEILGVGIGRHAGIGGIAYLSGRYLNCSQAKGQSWAAICTIEIAGRPLEIRAQRNPPMHPNQLGGDCEAFYAGKQWPCRIDSRHLHVAWFAYLDEPLGLGKDQLDGLRQKYLLENLPESSFFNIVCLATIVSAVLALLASGAWLGSRVSNKFSRILTATLCATVVGLVSFGGGILLTSGFWD